VGDSNLFDVNGHMATRALKGLNYDAAGCLRVAAVSNANITTVGTITNLTNWGLRTATVITQQESQVAFQQGFRRNLVHT
jgi:hypothetical protein